MKMFYSNSSVKFYLCSVLKLVYINICFCSFAFSLLQYTSLVYKQHDNYLQFSKNLHSIRILIRFTGIYLRLRLSESNRLDFHFVGKQHTSEDPK